ncbi:retinoic acid early transcript 1E [Erinaceus europaeus]|uniref:Retinoic acid early transcript 1E n=1 Tax=Erinaceus europaeus TaxID=9365 RepID=A0ABM3YJS9_ERIEU|nr:retinoic acid early transcript 1E [Erinaceus europaeus]
MKLAALTAGFGLILLLLEARETLGGAHSLCLNLTVRSQASPGQPWCVAQGSVDGKPFLQYDSDSSKVTPVGLLGEKVKDTKAWRDVAQTVNLMGRELRKLLSDMYQKKCLSRGPPSLQAQLCCQREAGECTGASWEFSIDEQRALIDMMTMNWTVIDPGARGIKSELVDNSDLAEDFKRISIGDCSQWLKGFLEHWEKMLEPTVIPDASKSSPSTSPITRIHPMIFMCSVLMTVWLQM